MVNCFAKQSLAICLISPCFRLVLEAKKSGNYFDLPNTYDSRANSFFCSVKVLLTDPKIKIAIEQVRRYCMDEGCQLASITNGHQWIFFKAFENKLLIIIETKL